MKEFRDRVAVVTGAGSGIGRAMAWRFAREGMRIVLADVEAPALEQTAREMKDAGASVLAVLTDVSEAAAVEALAVKTWSEFGAAHIVCNNAGVATRTEPCWQLALEDWQWVLRVNLWGVIHGIRSFVPRMLDGREEGHIVNTASLAGLTSSPFLGPYHASKHAVVTISECLYLELLATGAKLRASVLCPAWVNTRIAESERNRPGAVSEAASGGMADAIRKLLAEGLAPEAIAERVFAAVRDEQFWILTHPEWTTAIEGRAAGIVAERNPELPPRLV